jgi:hypothetical protein
MAIARPGVVNPRERFEAVERALGLDLDRGAREMAQFGEGPRLDRSAGTDDAHAIAERLDLGEYVAREQHGDALVGELANALLEDRLHQRVQATRRLIEDEQLGARRERGDERDLLAVALRVRARLLGGVELEALAQLLAAFGIVTATQPAEDVDHLAAREVRPEAHLARDVREQAMEVYRIGPWVAAEQRDRAVARA